eukprot:scaffold429_cov269-Pinguiococcus_pyrenoidosus.AAC.21
MADLSTQEGPSLQQRRHLHRLSRRTRSAQCAFHTGLGRWRGLCGLGNPVATAQRGVAGHGGSAGGTRPLAKRGGGEMTPF